MIKRYLYLVATNRQGGFWAFIVKVILWCLSMIYALCVMIRRTVYKNALLKTSQLPQPVISIGNLTVGGTGKTPLTEYIAQALIMKGVRPVILTRGYMGKRTKGGLVNSDEAKMLADALVDVPVLVGPNRIKSARAFLLQDHADVFLLDDGFQHYQLFRDLNIVTIDTTNPWGNGHLIPRGILRESRRALKRADVFVLTKTDLGVEQMQSIKDKLDAINPSALITETIHKPVSFIDMRTGKVIDLNLVGEQKICAVSSIGSPDSFEQALVKLGAAVGKHFAFMDHHSYMQEDVDKILALCDDQQILTIVTTEKDAVKLKYFLDKFPKKIRVWFMKIKIDFINTEEPFLERIHRLL